MDTKKIISWLSLLLGETLIITAFILFRGNLTDNVLTLNIIVSTIIYGLFFVDILIPLVDYSDKSSKAIGSIGVRWLATWLYGIVAVAAMIISNISLNLVFSTQLIIHGILFFFLLLGFVAALHSSDRVNEVYLQETSNGNGIYEMKSAMQSLKYKMSNNSELPDYFIDRINVLEENLKFVSPSNKMEAKDLELSFVDTLNNIGIEIYDFAMNEESIESNLRKCEWFYQRRKNIYSK
ncbi:MAG: hypothetical protein ACK5MK_00925 [Dysgonomonas sp.]